MSLRDDGDEVWRAVQRLIGEGQLDAALELMRDYLASNPTDMRGLLKLGDVSLKAGYVEDAVATYLRVCALYESEGQALKAFAVAKHILRCSPNSVAGLALFKRLEHLAYNPPLPGTPDGKPRN